MDGSQALDAAGLEAALEVAHAANEDRNTAAGDSKPEDISPSEGSVLLRAIVAEDIKRFLSVHNVDDAAKGQLEALPLEQQIDVISQDASTVRNMSAVVISRASKCQKEGPQYAGPASQGFVLGLVNRYIEALNLEENVSITMKGLPPKLQILVMAKDVEGTNPSACVDGRIKQLLEAGSTSTMPLQPAPPMSAVPALPPVVPVVVAGNAGNSQFDSSALTVPMPVDATLFLEQACRVFVVQYAIDPWAQDLLAELTPMQKIEVISQGMESCKNPSGVIASRCARVAGAPLVLGPRAVQWVTEVSALFCQSYGIELQSEAVRLLTKLPAEKQFEICSLSLAGARNPQSVLYCRIQKLGMSGMSGMSWQQAALGVAPTGITAGRNMAAPPPNMAMTASLPNMATMSALPNMATMGTTAIARPTAVAVATTAEVDRFAALYRLDDRAAGALRELALQDPQGAQEVMMLPITPEVRNPSGVIHARVMNRTGQSKKDPGQSKKAMAAAGGARVGPY
mmetsp:Transcript_69916/g.138420  ORF Transcript_69916/g.138420 Transcript_69916/m.138420 type:complete len:512 (+) Transcript_69916:168-1703(+)|eukprot:CAMPEP_0172656694 /NCGR_PEP_ID=MMETSP1074-20121228/1525_1 /TAXON_ID=2916 /ORGANISM="Ceratium fusus, Strain PA161109" /LENGTH=511 /DNA_ID=CAMNT_0013471575 /DNA_START=163 /DNA_END=1698 /DNA_ORIENTATION=+